jgi:hypothetical protein
MLRERLWEIKTAPDDKSIHQLREDAIIQALQEVTEEARMRALLEDLYAVGKTPEECIRAYAASQDFGPVETITELEEGDPKYTWGRRFYVGGTSMKAAGWAVPGGVIMTWLK